MKRNLFIGLLSLTMVIVIWSCKKDTVSVGSLHGMITNKTTGEPMRAAGVELHIKGSTGTYSLLMKTVTYDDGRYEFNDLKSGDYILKVDIEGYVKISYSVVVEENRTANGDMHLEKLNTYMVVKTLEITDIKGNSATLNGSYSNTSYNYPTKEYGFVYATHSNPSSSDTEIKASSGFVAAITNLAKATYYVRAYAINSIGIEYGEERTFQINGLPSVITLPTTNATTATTATLNGSIEYQGDPNYTERGFVYSKSFQNPTVEDSNDTKKVIVSGTSTDFSANISGLTAELYYARAYVMVSSNVYIYGQSVSFTPGVSNDVFVLKESKLMVMKQDLGSASSYPTATVLCNGATVGGHSDWRLPTISELSVLYTNRNAIGGFASSSYYWSSTSCNSYDSYRSQMNFSSTYINCSYSTTAQVRAVRTSN